MKWLKITVVFFLVTLVKCGPTRSEEDPGSETEAAELKITRIERTGRGTTLPPTKDTFQFTLDPQPTADRYGLVVSADTVPEHPVLASGSTLSFTTSLADYYGQNSNFLIQGYSTGTKDPVLFAEKDINPFPTFPGDLHGDILKDLLNPVKDLILRVEGNLGSMKFTDKDIVKIVENTALDIGYYKVTGVSDYSLCETVDSVEVCDNPPFKPDDPVVEPTWDEILTSATLSYGTETDPYATVKLKTNTNSGDIYEAIILSPVPEDNVLCNIDGTPPIECKIKWEKPSNKNVQLMIIRKTTIPDQPNEDLWTTSSVVIHDRELIATSLGSDILEGRWNMHDGESIYQMVKTDTTTKNEETKIVDCSDLSLDPKVCFGYFPHMKTVPGTYTVTVAYQISDNPPKYNETDKIESSTRAFPPAPSTHELGILSRHMTRHSNQLMADVNICFQHLNPQEGGAFSHYEMLIINEKGQWLKHRILEEEEGEGEEVSEGRLCFAPFTINTKDFDLTEGTKVVISQRGVDGFTVLATGESKLL